MYFLSVFNKMYNFGRKNQLNLLTILKNQIMIKAKL